MIKVQVEFLSNPSRSAEIHQFSRVPCVGELIVISDHDASYEVRVVFHIAGDISDKAAIVRVKG